MRVLFVRHGQSEANVRRIVNGDPSKQFSLTENGKAQAEALAARLRDEPIDAIFSSQLPRAIETATILCGQRGLAISIDARLNETCEGDFEGKRLVGIRNVLVKCALFIGTGVFGIERPTHIRARMASFIEDLRKQPCQTVLVVSHGLPLKMARSHIEHSSMRLSLLRDIPNCGVLEYAL